MEILFILIFIGFAVNVSIQQNHEDSESCALRACNKLDPNKINVHLIAHSHDDVGWLKTLNDYFYGLHDEIHNAGVEYTIDSTLQALKQNSNRRYIQVETAFFWKWWKKQTQTKRDIFKKFVDTGKIEMVGGGWAMNDEACVNYQSTINQFTWGLRLLNDTLGECAKPRIGWQIDPFGHSREQASIFKQMGYDAIFLTRISEDDRKQRKLTKDIELMWKSNDNFDNSEIFTSIMDGYFAPNDFCWDYMQCSSDALNDDPESFDYNLDKKVVEFSKHIANYSSYLRTNNVIITMGGDFQYQAAEINFLNIDKLIKGFENHEKYNVFYSTPSCYIQAIKASNVEFSIKETGDFFPYNENAHVYWSGFYTSRSTLKRYERMGNNILQAAQNLNAFGKLKKICKNSECEENIRSLREAVGTMQHHDAITGTEKERVAYDYSRMLTKAIRDTEKSVGKTVGNLLKLNTVTKDVTLPLSTCLLTNISVCDQTLQDRSLIVLYNPLPKQVSYHIKLPVQDGTYKLTGNDGDVNHELIQHIDLPIKYPFKSSDTELVASTSIPPMGIKVFYLQKTSTIPTAIKPRKLEKNERFILGKDKTQIIVDQKSNTLTIFSNERNISHSFMYYLTHNGTGSGAYVFRPAAGSEAVEINGDVNNDFNNIMLVKGKYNEEVYIQRGDYIKEVIKTFSEDNLDYIEIDWVVGPLDNKTVNTLGKIGKEIIVRYSVPDVKTNYFYTDSNGRQMVQRERNNYSFDNISVEPIASNYYPITSRITIKNETEDFQFSILTDRSQGGSSLKDGEVELMLHRRTLKDDGKGLDETLEEMEYDEYIVTKGQHYLVTDSSKSSRTERILALNKLRQPWILVADATSDDMSLEKLQSKISFMWIGCKGLAPNLNVLNFEPWIGDSFLIRLEHIFERNEDTEYSSNASVELKYMFEPYVISSIREMSLAANSWIDETIIGANYTVTLGPMEIRTFAVTFEH